MTELCPSCPPSGRYCAPLRCYCGHPACPAYPTYEPPEQRRARLAHTTTPNPARTGWDDRTHTTWLENL